MRTVEKHAGCSEHRGLSDSLGRRPCWVGLLLEGGLTATVLPSCGLGRQRTLPTHVPVAAHVDAEPQGHGQGGAEEALISGGVGNDPVLRVRACVRVRTHGAYVFSNLSLSIS